MHRVGRHYSNNFDPEPSTHTWRTPMKKFIAASVLVLATTSANAFWGGPFFGNGLGDGYGDGNMSFNMSTNASTRAYGNGYGYNAPDYGYAPYGYAPAYG